MTSSVVDAIFHKINGDVNSAKTFLVNSPSARSNSLGIQADHSGDVTIGNALIMGTGRCPKSSRDLGAAQWNNPVCSAPSHCI
jgi:hypothetical protein